MYQTSDDYKSKIYLPSTKHLLKIFINNIEIDKKYILGFKPSHRLFNNDEFTFGSVTSKALDLKLYKTAVPDIIESIYIVSGIEGEEVPIGYFNVEERTSEDDYTTTLKLLDNMIKFEVNYDGSKLNYPRNLMTVLTDICNKVGVELGSTSFLNQNAEIAVYDNAVSARTYLSYIAEQAGGFAFIGRDGKLYIKTIGEDIAELPIQYFQDFKWGEQFKVSRVRYEDGVQLFEKGNETNNTIYINQENMYIVDQEQIDNIYDKYKDFNCYSFEGNSIIDPALDIGDLLLIDGKYIIYQGDMEYVGKFKANISSKIQAKTKEETMVRKPSQKVVNRRVQSQINQAEGKITEVIQSVGEQSSKILEVEKTVNGVTTRVESVEKNVEKVETNVSNLDSKVDNEVSNLQSQIDGQIQFWNGEAIPTINNYPATEWTTGEAKNNHRADIYTVIEDIDGELKQGKSYRFDKVGNNWVWVELTDNELSAVQALAQSKAKVFTTTPKPPYNVSDLWLKDKELLECIVAKDSNGVFAESDWQVATKYTDDTIANLANLTANTALDGVNNITATQATLEGTEIKIDDGAEEPIIKLEVDGHSTQETREGYNEVDLSKLEESTLNGVTVTRNEEEITLNGTATAQTDFVIIIQKQGTTFSLYTNVISGDLNGNIKLIARDDNDSKSYRITNDITAKGVIVMSSTFEVGVSYITIRILNGTVLNNVKLKLMLLEGTYTVDTIPTYEKYGKSPSPEFPSEIQSLGDDVNLLDLSNLTNRDLSAYGIKVTKNNDGSFTLNGTSTNSYGFNVAVDNPVELKANTSYVLSTTSTGNASSTSASQIAIRETEDTNLLYKNFANSSKTYLPTEDKTINYIRIYFDKNVTFDNFTIYPKLQKGTVATAYSEYGKGTIEIKQSGTNLFDIDNATNYFIAKRGVVENTDAIFSGYIEVEDNTHVTIGSNSYWYNILGFFDADKNILSTKHFNSNNTLDLGDYATDNIEIPEGTVYIAMSAYKGTTQIMVALGQDIEYEPYFENKYVISLSEPLRSLPNGVCDTIEEDGIHRRVKEVVFDGTESWRVDNNGTRLAIYEIITGADSLNSTGLCNYFSIFDKHATQENSFGLTESCFRFYNSWGVTTNAEVKAKIAELYNAGTPLKIIYPLAEEVIEPFDEEQQAVIDSITTMLGTQYFTCDANMRITYVRDNGLSDMYETKDSAIKKYTDTETKISELNIGIGSIGATVGEVTTRLENDYMTTDQIEAETGTLKEDIDVVKKQQASMELTSKGLQVQIDSINNDGVKTVKNTLVEIDEEGIKVSKGSEFNSLLDDTGVYLKSYDKEIASYTKDGATMYNLTVQNEAIIGNLRALSVDVNAEKRTHIHWIGG